MSGDRSRLRELEMEVELLTLEVEALRSRGRSEGPDDPAAAAATAERDRAVADIRRVLRRLGSGPVGFFVRRTRGYRRLAARYLDEVD